MDVASVDRRDKRREEESMKRVSSLVEAFKNSSIHINTVSDIAANKHKLPSPSEKNRAPGPGYIRVFLTILR